MRREKLHVKKWNEDKQLFWYESILIVTSGSNKVTRECCIQVWSFQAPKQFSDFFFGVKHCAPLWHILDLFQSMSFEYCHPKKGRNKEKMRNKRVSWKKNCSLMQNAIAGLSQLIEGNKREKWKVFTFGVSSSSLAFTIANPYEMCYFIHFFFRSKSV